MTGRQEQPLECPLCHRRFPTVAAQAGHTCQLGEKFFQKQIPRWRAAGVGAVIAPTDYDRQLTRENGR